MTAVTAAVPSLHQPKRALIAAGEVVAIVLLVLAARWCWERGVLQLEYPVEGKPPLTSTRYHGNWIGGSIALVTLAAVLLLDVVRQVILAVRARPRRQTTESEVDTSV